MTAYAVYADWSSPDAVGEALLMRISSTFRPDDKGVCVWVPDDRPSTLRIGADVEACDGESALVAGREAIDEAALLGPLAAAALGPCRSCCPTTATT